MLARTTGVPARAGPGVGCRPGVEGGQRVVGGRPGRQGGDAVRGAPPDRMGCPEAHPIRTTAGRRSAGLRVEWLSDVGPTTVNSCPRLRWLTGIPVIGPDELITGLVPPPRFDAARFQTYRPNPAEPSQQAARRGADRVRRADRQPAAQGSVPQDRPRPPAATTSTVASGSGRPTCWPRCGTAVPGPKAYGTFVEYTHLVGALGFNETVRRLTGHRLLAVDEFELDDPGDTMLMTRLLGPAVRDRGAPGRHVEHAAGQTRRGPVRRRGFPSGDPCAVSTFRHPAGGRAGLPARRAGRRAAADAGRAS